MNLFSLGGFFSNIWMDLWIALNSVVYQIIEWLYEVFEAIANVNLFSKEAFNDITSRLYVVIGIAMLFIFAYNIILMIINPDDKKSTGNTGKVVKETIIALVLVILLPRIFNYMSIFQRNILDSHILEQIILGDTAGTEVECNFSDLELIDSYVTVDGSSAVAEMTSQCNNYQQLNASQKGAYLVAPTIFTAFFHPTNYGYDECVNYLTECKGQGTNCVSNDGKITTDDDKELCAYYVYDTNIGQFKGGIANFVTDDGVYAKAWSDLGIFDFNYLMAFVAGILAVIMFFRYSLAIGVRIAKLGFFQIISPIPVMMRIIPKQKEAFYDKWFKHLVEEYLDVFVRLAIIYFALFAISLVPDVMDSLFASLTGNIFTKGLAAVVVILGILKFAGDAPDLIKEFFGSSGRYALKSASKQLSENKLGSAALGAVGGALSSGVGNLWNAGRNIKNEQGWKKGMAIAKAPFAPFSGAIGGAFRGAKKGYGASDFKDLGNRIAEAKYDTDAAYERGVIGGIKHRAKKVGDSFSDFGDFITGTGATDFRLKAIEKSLSDVQGVNATFKSGNIESIEAAFNKMSEEHKNEKDVKFGGREYTYTPNGWVDKNDPSSTPIAHNDLGKMIKAHFDEMKKDAYIAEFAKNEQAFERITNKMLNTLNENFPKIGQDIIAGINKGLGETIDANGIRFNNTDEITDKISDLMKKMNATNDATAKEQYKKQIYDINDVLEKNLKNVKKNEVIAQQEKKDK